MQATVGYLTGRIGASQREVQDILATVCQTEVSVGSVGALEQAVSAALATPVAEAATYVQRQPVRNADETSWREKTKRVWLWISVTPLVTIFRVLKSRGAAAAKELLGEDVWGTIGTDRYAGYHWIDPRQRQLCWAHLKREFIAWSERAGETARIGLALLAVEQQLFALMVSRARWHDGVGRLSSGDAAADGAGQYALTGRRRGRGRQSARDVSQSAQTGTRVVDVCVGDREWNPPTIARSGPYGGRYCGDGAVSARRVKRAVNSSNASLPTVTTLRQQRRDVLDYLTAACAAAIRKDPAPSLLPLTSPPLTAR